jgi:hypothetical protein
VIATLRQSFVNVWLLAKDLDDIAARSGDADVQTLCRLVRENYDYPVDSVLIAPDLRVVGHVNVHDPKAMQPAGYLAFLRAGLTAVHGAAAATRAVPEPAVAPERAGVRAVTLTPDAPTGTILDVILRRAFGAQSLTYFPIDATAFENGGRIEIAVRVGGRSAAGKFELCAPVTGGMAPVRVVQVTSDESATLVYEFSEGARFGLAAIPGAGSKEGDATAFLATVTVRGR